MSDTPTPSRFAFLSDLAPLGVLAGILVVLLLAMFGVLAVGNAVREAARAERIMRSADAANGVLESCNRRLCHQPHFHIVSPDPKPTGDVR